MKTWISEMVRRLDFSYRAVGGRYPCKFREYSDLADHPRTEQEGYFEEATEGSVLLPTLAFWAAALDETEALAALSRLKTEILSHCAMQLWLPGAESEPLLWRGQEGHGAAFVDIPVVPDGRTVVDYVLRECGSATPFHGLSAVRQGVWPLVLVACRHHRLPIPPHFWAAALPRVVEPPDDGAIDLFQDDRRPSMSRNDLMASTSRALPAVTNRRVP